MSAPDFEDKTSMKRIPAQQEQGRMIKKSCWAFFLVILSYFIEVEGNEAIISVSSCIVLKSTGKGGEDFHVLKMSKNTNFGLAVMAGSKNISN